MKFTLSWLKDHLDFDNPLDEVLETLIKMGIEVESVENYQEKYKDFSIGYIKSAEKHPNADKLQVCKVDTKDGELQIVCGAFNARAGIYVVFAPSGSYIPGIDVVLKSAKIRDVESNGMMLSEREMGLSDDHDGIIEFESGVVGSLAAEKLGLNDIIIDVSITPNRGDLLGVRGIAKDLASFGIGKLKPLPFSASEVSFKEKSKIKFYLDKEISQKFLATKIMNVKNVDSPQWLKQKLNLIGQESRGLLVDISNFICFDLNQPMHCYDLNKLQADINAETSIKVEFSQNEFKYTALDDKEYTLSSISPIVNINGKVGAIAGIKGSKDTCVDETTKNILLECALFDNKTVALAKRELGINTESSYRYEREIDRDSMNEAFLYAVHLITTICGATENTSVESFVVEEHKIEPKKLTISLGYINQLVGVKFKAEEITKFLEKLRFNILKFGDIFEVVPPSNRNDIDDKSVIVAEIIRLYSADNLPKVEIYRNSKNINKAFDYKYATGINAKKTLAKLGMQEVVSMSFISNELANLFGIFNEDLTLQNPISEDLAIMRKSLIPSLMLLAGDNIKRNFENLRLFEVANIYNDSSTQESSASGILVGNSTIANWQQKAKPYDVWHAKEIIFALINSLKFNPENMSIIQKDLPKYYHPYKSASLNMGKNVIGYFGEIHPSISDSLNIKVPTMAFELFIDRLPEPKNKGFTKPALNLPEFMPVLRDFAFIVDKETTAGEIIRLTKSVDKKNITNVDVFDVYEGNNIEKNKKSIAITAYLQATNKTFVESEIIELSNKIIATLAKSLNAKLRDAN
ncbi:MAG: phenylalanine--tRNA ligase subunit beta [Alphaproteobacteria bacterium]|jgi:phenylalanyl-tRNA synthetase beta chain|nr:phenylalanine--tRNA ligase subunit beta [Alphaproteobacteria bacterium]